MEHSVTNTAAEYGAQTTQCVTVQASEHEMLINVITAFQNAVESKDSRALHRYARDLYAFLRDDMRDHFQLEEEVFFPAFCLTIHSVQTSMLVLKLQKEHGTFEKEAELLAQLIEKQSLEESLQSDLFIKTFRDLANRLREHAVNEINHLFPHIDRNKRCCHYVRKLAARRELGTH